MNLKTLAKGIFCVCLVMFYTMAYAQNKEISGKVTDSKDGSPIAGITVSGVTSKGKKIGTATATDGTFKLASADGISKVTLSGAGFEKQEVDVTGKSDVSISMKAGNLSLNEVVVIGYGNRKVKDLTGSVAALSTKDFNKGVISTPEQLFQGRTPGVTITPSSGEPGAASTINIRGTSSIRGNNDPLYVVDGVPLDGGGTSATNSGVEGTSTPKNPLLFLNPNDIESISILKDASSAGIYGSRGANGVIIITTKSGRGKKGSFSFGQTTSFSKTAKRYDLLKAPDFLAGVRAANILAGTSVDAASAAVLGVNKGDTTDWQDQIFQTGISQNYNLGWGFANKGTALRISGSYDDQKGIVISSGLKRATGRANFSQKFWDDKLKFDATFTYSNVKNQYSPNTNNAGYQGSLIGAAITFNPTFPVFDKTGRYYDPGDGNRNPVEMINYFDDRDNINRLLTNVSLSYTIVKGLTYKATFGYDDSKSKRKSFADPRLGSGAFGGSSPTVNGVDYHNPIFGNGRAFVQDLKLTSTLVEHTLTYDKSFNGMDLDAIGGYSYQGNETTGSSIIAWGLKTPVVNPTDIFVKDENNFVNTKPGYIPFYSKTELQSFFGRVNYTINNKYYLTATVRSDGSSKFGANNRYGTFPSFAAKWKLLNESFATSSLGKIFSDFSIRANYGKLGSQDGLDAYSAVDYKSRFSNNSGVVDTTLVHQENKKLKWETATTIGVGLDFALKGNRLSGTIDYYHTKRQNLIYFGPTPGGFSATTNYYSNLPGYVENKGFEFSLNYQAIKNGKFHWDISYNMTFLHNELKEFKNALPTGAVNGQGLSGAYAQTFANGYPLFTFKMPVYLGLDVNGNASYADGTKDHLLGSPLPTFTAGITNNFSLGRWNASIFMNTSRGFYVYNNTANALLLKGSLKTAHNVTYSVLESYEDPINPGSVSSRFLEKGDFIRLSNAIISYNFDIKNKVIKSLSASISGQNLALITNYSGLDPEVNVDHNINGIPSRGFDYAGYPKARTVSIGINLGF